MHDKDAVFTLTVEDVQKVAKDQLGRSLTQEEMEIFKDEIGDYLGWWEASFAGIFSLNCIEQAVIKGEQDDLY